MNEFFYLSEGLTIMFNNLSDLPEITINFVHNSALFKVGQLNSRFYYISYNFLQTQGKNISSQKAPMFLENDWLSKPEVVKSIILHAEGKSKKIHARKCECKEIPRDEARLFLETNHLMGFAGNGKSWALMYQNTLVAVATFSKARTMHDRAVYYKSYELVRFATLPYLHINGGLNKLLKAFINANAVKHLMTYTPSIWGEGLSFARMGFKVSGRTEPITLFIDPHRHTYIRDKNDLISDAIEITLPPSKKWVWESEDLL